MPSVLADAHRPGIDPVAAQRWLRYPQTISPWLHDEVGKRMAQRLAWINTPVTAWLNWEPVQGGAETHALVRQHYSNALFFYHSSQSKKAQNAIKKVVLNSSSLWQKWRGLTPLQWSPAIKVDLLWANMALHQHSHPKELLQQWRQCLNPNGFLMFSCLGPDSLKELKMAYHQLGWGHAGHDYTDMHDWGDLLLKAGFSEPVMDMERITLSYGSITRLLSDLREMGRNLHPQRSTQTRGRLAHQQWCEALAIHWPQTHDGNLELSFEIVYGHAHQRLSTHIGTNQQIPLSEMRQMLKMKPS